MMTLGDISKNLEKLHNWSLDANSITKEFEFNNFNEVLGFLSKIAELVDKYEHYPTILISKNQVRTSLTTIGSGLTEKDFNFAKDIDKISA